MTIKKSIGKTEIVKAEFLVVKVTSAFTEALEIIENSEEYIVKEVNAEIMPGTDDYQIMVKGSRKMGLEDFNLEEPILKFESDQINEESK